MWKTTIAELNAFWPLYLSHHRHRANRAMHDMADVLVIGGLIVGVATGRPLLVVAGVGLGYAVVFAGHFLVEKNVPATFGHPVLAGISNWRMFASMISGRLDEEFERYGLEQTGEASWGLDALRSRLVRAFGRSLGVR